MLTCEVCGNIKVPHFATVCTECGTEIVQSAAPSVSPAAAVSPTIDPPAGMLPQTSIATPPPLPRPYNSSAEPATSAKASLTVVRGGALTNEKLTWAGSQVVVGKFDVDEGPIDVDLSQLPEAGYVSRRHCEVRIDAAGQWFVKDLGSSNGTFVRPVGNQRFQKVSEDQPLKDGDELALGNARFVFHTESAHA